MSGEEGDQTIRYIIRILDIGSVYYLMAGVLAIVFWVLMQRKNVGKRIAVTVLIPYLFLVLCSTVFTRQVKTTSQLNVRPFWTIQEILTGGAKKAWLKKEIALNILMLMPVGLVAPMLFDECKMLKTILIGIEISVMIEVLQFVMHRGLAEVDDIFNNSLGVMIGYTVNKGMIQMVKCYRQRKKYSDPGGYGYKACAGKRDDRLYKTEDTGKVRSHENKNY